MEQHIITVCLVILAAEPARKLWRGIRNRWDRWTAHREWKKHNA